jgi:tetratricopeptide (TPR) repeat protein
MKEGIGMPAPKGRKSEDLDFQMSFYEGVLKENPNFVEALIALGEIYTKKGMYDKGLKIDKKLSRLRPDNPIIHYNLACSLSLLGELSNSFKAIKQAIELGYNDFIFMNNDPDLANLRSDERFIELVKKVKGGSLNTPDVQRNR